MSLIYGLDEFKKKLQACGEASDVRSAYAVIVDQVSDVKKAVDELREKLEEKENLLALSELKLAIDDLRQKLEDREIRLAGINLEDYKSAMVSRLRELTGR